MIDPLQFDDGSVADGLRPNIRFGWTVDHITMALRSFFAPRRDSVLRSWMVQRDSHEPNSPKRGKLRARPEQEALMRLIPVAITVSLCAMASDKGVSPRTSAADYDARQSVTEVTLAAAIVPARQIERLFSAEIARQFIVLEVAVYPQSGQTFDVDWFDFGLKIGATVAHVEKPRDVVTVWPEKNRVPDKPVTVTSETGVVYGRTSDPVNGHRTIWGTYEGVGVTNDPRAAPPAQTPRQGADPQIIEQRVREKMLPEGRTGSAIAGYLFFPQLKRKRHQADVAEFQWSKDNASATLRLPLR